MTVDFETKCEQTALDYIKIHLQEGYLVTAYKDVGNYYWESVYKIRASLSTNRKTESSSEKPNNCEDFFREPTAEERKAVADYIDSISVPTGVNVFDLMDEPQTDCPRSCPSRDICTKDATDCPWK